MEALIIYYSKYKENTKRIAEIIAEVIGAELIKSENLNAIETANYDLIGFGSGVYDQKQHQSIFEAIEKLDLKNKNCFVFSTSAAGIEMYNKNAIDLLTAKGAVVKGSFSCKGFYTNKLLKMIGGVSKGHPNNNDLTNAKNFAKKLVNSEKSQNEMQK